MVLMLFLVGVVVSVCSDAAATGDAVAAAVVVVIRKPFTIICVMKGVY